MQAQLLRGFITTNTVVDHVEIAQTIVGVDDDQESHFPLVWLALAFLGDELYGVSAGDSVLDAVGNLACTRLFSGHPCPNCKRPVVFYDGLSERWTYDANAHDPWAEYICPIFFDDDLADWRRACTKTTVDGTR